ncbi:alkaline phosphatase D family protein [Brachybacterium phenoliresistens]|uniref:Alkaline phosphatase n=1 Tax=Brachybacterium phenoliresistens TaxID=396014 RepID=Z9JRF9_9MICO|nr:alkaline phosphatase D family protein [Brachybacterium phenoliresistens]EWS80970.1 alkaline phosphatase [Brachybacterium phenoliresistens]
MSDLSGGLLGHDPHEPTRFIAPDRRANLAAQRRLTRRHFTAAGLTTLAASGVLGVLPAAADATWKAKDPFTLGIASGDPTSSSVVLWTRLAVDPHATDGRGGMPDQVIPVHWELSRDERFAVILRRGTEQALPEAAHSVHVELEGLPAGTELYYRFRTGKHVSAVGRTLTTPADGDTRSLRMIHVSCSHWEGGYFTAYRRAAEDRPDLVFGLGDYIYEGRGVDGRVRRHPGSTCTTLEDYRLRYATYKTDPDLQLLHATAPWIVTWDDHEIQDNWAGVYPKDGVPTDAWVARKIAAEQAYYENMPLRRSSAPSGGSIQLFRRLSWGDLATFHVLDTRQYRDLQACHDGGKTWWFTDCAEQADPSRTLLGQAQQQWLIDGMTQSSATWQLLAQSVFFAKRDNADGPTTTLSSDGWDGYRASRDALVSAWSERGIANPVVLTGDVHVHFANELKADFWEPDSPTVGVELVTSSITSGGDGSDVVRGEETVYAENPHIRYIRGRRGYVLSEYSTDALRVDYKTVSAVTVPDAEVSIDRSYLVPAGEPGLHEA